MAFSKCPRTFWGRLTLGSIMVYLTAATDSRAQAGGDAATEQGAWVATVAPVPPRPAAGEPVEVELTLTLNKVSDIDTIAETYNIDAYVGAKWRDPAAVTLLLRSGVERSVYLDDAVSALLGQAVWWPDLELINTVGGRERTDLRVEVKADGWVHYNERFQATLSSNMDFRKFPFDAQTFEVRFESYTYIETEMVFARPHARLGHIQETPSPDWRIGDPNVSISRHEYGDGWYSRYTVSVDADRLPGYFVWQVFLPLFLILGTSWIVFWLNQMSDKLSVAFTCLLTIVAFNFYTSTMLPHLPYNTFIEVVVISAYVATFLLITFVLLAERHALGGKPETAERLLKAGRWLFPIGYAASVLWTVLVFF